MADPFPEIDFELSAQPHDAFFKSVFSDPVHTAALLHSHLPPEIVAQVDWNFEKPAALCLPHRCGS